MDEALLPGDRLAPDAPDLPVLAPWFRIAPIDGRTTLLQEPGLHRLIAANLWWVRGSERDLLIDSGNGVASLRAAVPALFERDPVLVLTHSHMDHMGGAHEFDEVWMHAAERASVEAPSGGSLLGGRSLADDGSLEGTALAVLPPLLIDAVPHAGYDPAAYELRPAAVTRELAEGDRVDLGDVSLTVLHLPGHTPGSIALLDERSGTLFTGDIVYDGILLDTGEGSSIPDYLDTMRRLRELDVRVVHGGHKPSFGRARLREIADEYLAFRGAQP